VKGHHPSPENLNYCIRGKKIEKNIDVFHFCRDVVVVEE